MKLRELFSRAKMATASACSRIGWTFPILLFIFAAFYYGSYGLSGLDLQGEGGTIGVVALRILQGQRPMVDTFLGYNLLWFLPVVWLFQLFGPTYVGIKAFFFTLCAVMGVFGYRILWRATGRPLLSLAGAIVIILVPGMQFRNYMGFLAVGNMMFLLEAFAFPHRSLARRLLWISAACAFVAATFLFRIDLGIFYSALLLGSALVNLLLGITRWKERIITLGASLVLLPVFFGATHWPFDAYAKQKGFERVFWSQYESWWSDLQSRAAQLLAVPSPLPTPVRPEPNIAGEPAQSSIVQSPVVSPRIDRSTRPLPDPKEILRGKRGRDRVLPLLIYAPPISIALILAVALWLGITGIWRGDSRKKSLSFFLLIATGSALALFPQYFLFRPDPPHLSEMMCAFVITSVCAFSVALELRNSGSRVWGVFGLFWSVLLFAHVALYARYGVHQPWMGSIAMKKKGEQRVQFDNGVIAFLPEGEKEELEELYETVKAHSTAGDYVVSFPYSPMINFMTNRRSYRFNLYVDNSTRPENFDAMAIQEIETYKPAVIAIDDVAMNLTESSRFSVWAAPTMAFIRQKYQALGNFVATDIYAREPEDSGLTKAAGP
ncbi:MAG: hypothetical protein WB586_24970 [Chthoniobacterales bacterium]